MNTKSFIDIDPIFEISIQEDITKLRNRILHLEEENNRLQLEIEAYQQTVFQNHLKDLLNE